MVCSNSNNRLQWGRHCNTITSSTTYPCRCPGSLHHPHTPVSTPPIHWPNTTLALILSTLPWFVTFHLASPCHRYNSNSSSCSNNSFSGQVWILPFFFFSFFFSVSSIMLDSNLTLGIVSHFFAMTPFYIFFFLNFQN